MEFLVADSLDEGKWDRCAAEILKIIPGYTSSIGTYLPMPRFFYDKAINKYRVVVSEEWKVFFTSTRDFELTFKQEQLGGKEEWVGTVYGWSQDKDSDEDAARMQNALANIGFMYDDDQTMKGLLQDIQGSQISS